MHVYLLAGTSGSNTTSDSVNDSGGDDNDNSKKFFVGIHIHSLLIYFNFQALLSS